MQNVSFPSLANFTPCTSAGCVSKVCTISLIAVLSFAANLLNLIILASTPSLRNIHGCFLASLSVADFGTGLVAATAIYPSAIHVWPYGDDACRCVSFFEGVFTRASSLTLTLLSIERYIAVVHPFKYTRLVTQRNGVFSIVGICWVIPILAYTGFVVIVGNYKFIVEFSVCAPAYSDDFVYTVAGLLVFFAPSLLIIGITSVCVSRALSLNLQRRESMLASANVSQGNTSPRLSRQAIKMFRLVRVVALAFYICWVPHVTVGLGFGIAGRQAPPVLTFFLYWLHLSSGLCNFAIYFAMNANFRRAAIQKARSSRLPFMKALPCTCPRETNRDLEMDTSLKIPSIVHLNCQLTNVRACPTGHYDLRN